MTRERTPALTRLLSRIEIDPESECWLWIGGTRRGYGLLRFGTINVATHRLAYETWVAPIPAGLQIDHLCGNRACCNPDHLEPVTPQENTARARKNRASKGIPARFRTHCPSGHKYEGSNLIINSEGKRVCRACREIAGRKAARKRDRLAYFAELIDRMRACPTLEVCESDADLTAEGWAQVTVTDPGPCTWVRGNYITRPTPEGEKP